MTSLEECEMYQDLANGNIYVDYNRMVKSDRN